MRIEDLKVIVTGAGGGLGGHFAKRLHDGGAHVVAADLDEARLAALADRVGPSERFSVQRLDVTDGPGVRRFVADAAERMGGINGLINNAGVLRDGLLVKRDRKTGEVIRQTDEDFDFVIGVNLTGATRMAREVAARMLELEQSPGVIINISSIARHGNRGQTNYVSAKAALAANTVTWMRELAPHGIRVGAIAPGMVRTPMTDGMRDDARKALVEAIPVGRIGDPEDIWVAARFIFECDYFNGRTIDVDGGFSF